MVVEIELAWYVFAYFLTATRAGGGAGKGGGRALKDNQKGNFGAFR